MKPVGARVNWKPASPTSPAYRTSITAAHPRQPPRQPAIAVRQPVEHPVEAGEEGDERAGQQAVPGRLRAHAA